MSFCGNLMPKLNVNLRKISYSWMKCSSCK